MLVKMSLFFREWEKKYIVRAMLYLLVADEFSCVFFYFSPQENREKKLNIQNKSASLPLWCVVNTRCAMASISYRQFFCFFFSFFLFSRSHLYHLISKLTEFRVFVFIFIELSILIVWVVICFFSFALTRAFVRR